MESDATQQQNGNKAGELAENGVEEEEGEEDESGKDTEDSVEEESRRDLAEDGLEEKNEGRIDFVEEEEEGNLVVDHNSDKEETKHMEGDDEPDLTIGKEDNSDKEETEHMGDDEPEDLTIAKEDNGDKENEETEHTSDEEPKDLTIVKEDNRDKDKEETEHVGIDEPEDLTVAKEDTRNKDKEETEHIEWDEEPEDLTIAKEDTRNKDKEETEPVECDEEPKDLTVANEDTRNKDKEETEHMECDEEPKDLTVVKEDKRVRDKEETEHIECDEEPEDLTVAKKDKRVRNKEIVEEDEEMELEIMEDKDNEEDAEEVERSSEPCTPQRLSPVPPPSPSSSLPTLSSPPRLPSPPPIPPLSPPPSSSPSPPANASPALPQSHASSSAQPALSPPASPLSSPPSPPHPEEMVAAQLNQLQQTVVSHILQYQAGVIAQFQHLQQQMLSQLNNGSEDSDTPHITITPQPITPAAVQSPAPSDSPSQPVHPTPQEKGFRKRRAGKMMFSPGTDETNNGEVPFKRKRTAFNDKQYKVLETTFEHNNFPDPIDQHCIALRIKTPYRSIKMWFQNKRASVRKRLQPDDKDSSSGGKGPVKNASDPDARWYCTKCPATFIAKKFLENHKEAHEQETLHCPHCNMGFTHRVLLDTHLISKCSSSTGVDLTHLKDEKMDDTEEKVTPEPPPVATNSLHPGLLLLQNLQNQQQQEHQQPPSSSPPPLIDSKALLQLQQNPLFMPQQHVMHQLLLAQLQAQRARQEEMENNEEQEENSEDAENLSSVKAERAIKEEKRDYDAAMDQGNEDNQGELSSESEQLKSFIHQQIQQLQQKHLQLQLQQMQQSQIENQILIQQQHEQQQQLEQQQGKEELGKHSLTFGGLTIYPVPNENEGKIRVKPEFRCNNDDMIDDKLPQPLTLQDQISSILRNQGFKSLLKVKKEPEDMQEDGQSNLQQGRARESMQDQIEAIIKHQEQQKKKTDKAEDGSADIKIEPETSNTNVKRHRRRTTVFNEVQLRTLYLHFTYCNFPDPCMFRIIGMLTKLEPQVIKIWFQNERSRQRKRALHFMDEVNSKEKPYKCRDCGMSFAMLTFLVKHSMRHNGDTNQDATVRTCPLCLQKWNREIFPAHLKSSHNVNWNLVDEKFGSSLVCHLCEEKFNDQDKLLVHKHKHLKDDYGVPPQCKICKTTFVNAVCLEAHMETHRLHEWTFKCNICDVVFHDKVLLSSHKMGHGVPLAPVSTTDRSRSQLQHTTVKAMHSKTRKNIDGDSDLAHPSEDNETNLDADSIENTNVPIEAADSSCSIKTSQATNAIIPQTILASQASSLLSPSSLNNLPPSSGPVSFVKLIPVQLIPVSSINNMSSGTGGQISTSPTLTTVSAGGPTTPSTTTATTTYISVPISLKGSSKTNPILNYLLEAAPAPVKPEEKKKKALPNLIPISQAPLLTSVPQGSLTNPSENTEGDSVVPQFTIKIPSTVNSGGNIDSESGGKEPGGEVTPEDAAGEGAGSESEEQSHPVASELPHVLQLSTKKRYVPILPLMPLTSPIKDSNIVVSTGDTTPLSTTTPPPLTAITNTSISLPTTATTTTTISVTTTTTPRATISYRLRQTRSQANKKLWQAPEPDGYKRRRTPTYFTGVQREVMDAHFSSNNFPEPGEQMAIAHQLGIEYPVVKTWFQNTRKNHRRQLKEEDTFESEGPFHCLSCNVAFISRASLVQHTRDHRKETQHHCGECDIYFAHPVVYNTHLMNHVAKVGGSKKKLVVSEEEGASSSGGQMETSPQDSDNDDQSETDSQDEIVDEDNAAQPNASKNVPEKSVQHPEKEPQDCDVPENYDPSMAVECILDNSSGGEQEAEEEIQEKSHKCEICGENFTSMIALKEHSATQCSNKMEVKNSKNVQKTKAGGGWKRKRKVGRGRRKQRIGAKVRCYECRAVFPNRQTYLLHFDSSKCSASRQRIEYTEEEQQILVTHYEDNNFPMPSEMSLLARRLGVRYRQIMHWFQNRRSKERKQQNERKYPPAECGECKSTFVTSGNLKNHCDTVHRQLNGPVSEFACLSPGCHLSFTNADLLVTHRLSHLTETEAQVDGSSKDSVGIGSGSSSSNGADGDSGSGSNSGPLLKNNKVLEAHYSDNNFPEPMDIGFIARRLQVEPINVHIWYKNRRTEHQRKLEEENQETGEGNTGVSCQRAQSKTCTECKAAFISQTDLDTHKEMHKTSSAHKCIVCGSEFSNFIALETHWIRHGVEVKPDSAPPQPAAAKNLSVTTPKEVKTEKMAKASFNSTQLKILDTHYKHNNFPSAMEVWLVAKRLDLRPRQVTHWFQNKRGRDRRMNKLPQPSSHPCFHCGAAFICVGFLKIHRKLHRSLPKSPCEKCSANFLSPLLLETHMLYHDVLPKTKASFRKLPEGTKDPISDGQVRPEETIESDDSEGSEPQLRIDLCSSQLGGENTEGSLMSNENIEEEDDLRVYIDNAEAPQENDFENENEIIDENIEDVQIDEEEPDDYEKAREEISAILKDVGIELRETEQTEKSDNLSTQEGYDTTEESVNISTQSYDASEKTQTVDEMAVTRSSKRKEKESDVGDEFLLDDEEFCMDEDAIRTLEKSVVHEEVFFEDNSESDSDDDEDEPRLKIVSAYTMSPVKDSNVSNRH